MIPLIPVHSCLRGKKYIGCFLVVFCSHFSYGHAANVSVMIVETGAGAVSAKGMADLWEDTLMNVFFNAGHIVFNARSKRIARFPTDEFPSEALRDFQDASEGGSEFFALMVMGYADSMAEANARPEIISLRLYSVSPYKILSEENIIINKNGRTIPYEEIIKKIQSAAGLLLAGMGKNVW